MTIKNLIFDLDGTLIDSSAGVVEAVNYSLKMVGAPPQEAAAIKKFIGYSLATMYPHFTDAPYDELRRHFRVKASEVIVRSTVLLPNVAEVLQYLHGRGYRMAIATTKVRPNIDGILDKFQWRSIFPVSVGGDEVSQVKPAPDAFRLALERLKARPEESLVVGDTINDVLAARKIPMRVAAVRSPFGDSNELEAAEPDFMLGSLSELKEVLDRHTEGGLE